MVLEFNPHIRSAGLTHALPTQMEASKIREKDAPASKDSISSAAEPGAPKTDKAIDNKKWYDKPKEWLMKLGISILFCFKSIFACFSRCFSCFKRNNGTSSEMQAFVALVKSKKPDPDEIRKAYDKLAPAEKTDVIKAMMAAAGVNEESANNALELGEDFDPSLIARGVAQLPKREGSISIDDEIKRFEKAFVEGKPLEVLEVFLKLSPAAQRKITGDVAKLANTWRDKLDASDPIDRELQGLCDVFKAGENTNPQDVLNTWVSMSNGAKEKAYSGLISLHG